MKKRYFLHAILAIVFSLLLFGIYGCAGGNSTASDNTSGDPTATSTVENNFTGYVYAPTNSEQDGQAQSGMVILRSSGSPSGYEAVPGARVYWDNNNSGVITSDSSGKFSISFPEERSNQEKTLICEPPSEGEFSNYSPVKFKAYKKAGESDLSQLTGIILHPNARNIEKGEVIQLNVMGIVKGDTNCDIDPSLVTWQVDNSSVANVNANGLATGLNEGVCQVTASYEGLTVTGKIFVRSGGSYFNLSGRIANYNGIAVTGAIISVTDSDTVAITDSAGNFVMPHLPCGEDLCLLISLNGSMLYSRTINCTENTVLYITIPETTFQNGSASGRVVNTAGAGLSGVLISAGDWNTLSDDGGNYDMGEIPPGSYRFTFTLLGYQSVYVRIEIEPQKTTLLDVILTSESQNLGSLNGRVADSNGDGIEGAKIEYSSTGSNGSGTVNTDSRGYFSFREINSGNYTISASKDGYQNTSQQATVKTGAETFVAMKMHSSSSPTPTPSTSPSPAISATPSPSITPSATPTTSPSPSPSSALYYYQTSWGHSGTGNSEFNSPFGVAVDSSDNVYVADYYNYRIQKFYSNGNFIRKWGAQGAGDGEFNKPVGVFVYDDNHIYVSDWMNHRIQIFDPDGNFIEKHGTLGAGDGQFNCPYFIAKDSSGNIYVVDSMNYRVQKFDSSFNFILKWGSQGSGDGQFNGFPRGIVVDSSGNVYVADWSNLRIQKFDSNGNFISVVIPSGTGNGQVKNPNGLAIDQDDNLYVADEGNKRLQKFAPDGTFITTWGQNIFADAPKGIALDSQGNICAVEWNRILKFAPVR